MINHNSKTTRRIFFSLLGVVLNYPKIWVKVQKKGRFCPFFRLPLVKMDKNQSISSNIFEFEALGQEKICTFLVLGDFQFLPHFVGK